MGSRREFTRILGREGFESRERPWDGLPWAGHRVTLVYQQRRVCCQTCGVRTERVALPIRKRASRDDSGSSLAGLQSMPMSHAAVRRARGMRDETMLLLKLEWASARLIRSSRELAGSLHPRALH